MEQFSNLSLDDEYDQRAIRNDDPIGISRLSISDQTARVSPQLLSKYMPHFPTLPSPLRNSFSYVDATCDEMEIDECANEPDLLSTAEEVQVIQSTREFETPRVTFAVPDSRREDRPSPEEVLVIEEPDELQEGEIVEEEEEAEPEGIDNNSSKEDGKDSTAVIKALLSPTSLGVAAAAKIEGFPLPNSPAVPTGHPNSDTYPSLVESNDFQTMNLNLLKQDLRQRSKHQPIHVSINNHHHYYQDSGALQRPMATQPQDMGQLQIHEDDRYQLPVPWSPQSRPLSRGSYAFMSYLQLFLNGITVMAIFSVVTAFFRTLKTDIASSWEHRRLELAYESSRCKIQYLTNKCNLENRPALEEQCQTWEQCMNRNNDIFFRARSTLSAKLFGEIVNSFIEPIGWKALLVILMGVVVWCFCSNFLLGFARAKSYYGDASQQTPMHQRQRLKESSKVLTGPS